MANKINNVTIIKTSEKLIINKTQPLWIKIWFFGFEWPAITKYKPRDNVRIRPAITIIGVKNNKNIPNEPNPPCKKKDKIVNATKKEHETIVITRPNLSFIGLYLPSFFSFLPNARKTMPNINATMNAMKIIISTTGLSIILLSSLRSILIINKS